jgi:hypothetical protein
MDPELDAGPGDEEGGTPEHHLGAYISACCDDPNMDKAAKRKKILRALDLYDEPDVEEEEEEEEGEPAPQEKEKADQFHGEIGVGEEEEDDDEDDEFFAKKHRDDDEEEEEDGPMMARESLTKLRKHKDPKVRAVIERALRLLPAKKPVRKPAPESVEYRRMARRLDALEAEKIATTSVRQAITECKAAGLPKRVMTRLFVEDLADCTDPKRRRAMIRERAHLASINLPRSYGSGGVGGGPPRVSDAEFAQMVNGDAD